MLKCALNAGNERGAAREKLCGAVRNTALLRWVPGARAAVSAALRGGEALGGHLVAAALRGGDLRDVTNPKMAHGETEAEQRRVRPTPQRPPAGLQHL